MAHLHRAVASQSLIPCLQGERSREMPAAARVQGKYQLRAGAAPSRSRCCPLGRDAGCRCQAVSSSREGERSPLCS